MDEALHGLLGIPVGLFIGPDRGPGDELVRHFRGNSVLLSQSCGHGGDVGGAAFQLGSLAGGSFRSFNNGGDGSGFIAQVQIILHRILQTAGKGLAVGLGDTLGHAVVEVGDGLAAVLVVLVVLVQLKFL